MVLPRGLKAFVTGTAPGKLVKGKVTGYRAVDKHGSITGPALRGITKRLAEKLYSTGELTEEATGATEFKGTAWKGRNGGLRRGRAVDSQVSKLAGSSANARMSAQKYKLTKMAFGALENAGIQPICGQRVVIDSNLGIATAADMIGYRESDKSLVVVELKCGFSGTRTLPAMGTNGPQKMASPCSGAADCVLNRHLAQLTTTRHLLAKETAFTTTLKKKFGILSINGVLLYACDRDTSLYPLNRWWIKRGQPLIERLSF
jgi:hypothetical protein